MTRELMLAAIRVYQRYVSPYKGFCCAYRAHTGRASCSTLGYRAVRRYGALRGLALIRQRTMLCGVAHRRYGLPPPVAMLARQRGYCDFGFDLGCAPSCDAGSACPSDLHCLSDVFSSCNPGGCDSSRRSRRSSQQEKYVYIPPQVKLPGRPGPRPGEEVGF